MSISTCAISAAAIGRNGNGPQAEQAIYVANLNRGTPIHLLWTREEDFINTTFRSDRRGEAARRRRRDGWPIAMEVRTAHRRAGPGRDAGFDVAARYFAPNYRFSTHSGALPHPRGHAARRRRAGATFLSRELHGRACPCRRQGPVSLSPRADRAHQPSLQGRHDQSARHGRRDVGLGHAPAPRHRARHRARRTRRRGRPHATISAQVHTVSVSRQGRCVSSASILRMSEGFGLVNPLSVKSRSKARSPGSTTTRCIRNAPSRTAASWRAISTVPAVAHRREPARDQHRFFKTGHWLDGMGHDRGISIQSGIADAVFQITGKRYRDLPFRNHDLTWA